MAIFAVLTMGVLGFAYTVHAACPAGQQPDASGACVVGGGVALPNPLPADDIPTILGVLLRSAFGLLGSLALAMFIYGGFLWLTSGGAADRIEKGKNTMVWAVLGIAVAFTAYAIVDFVIGTITKK
jgi:hypothetical protein